MHSEDCQTNIMSTDKKLGQSTNFTEQLRTFNPLKTNSNRSPFSWVIYVQEVLLYKEFRQEDCKICFKFQKKILGYKSIQNLINHGINL